MKPVKPSQPSTPMLPDDLRDRLLQAQRNLDGQTATSRLRLPVWVATACLGAGLLITPACGGKKEKEAVPPAGLETALMKPAEMAMEPELESLDPMDPVPGQVEPPPGSLAPIPAGSRDTIPAGSRDTIPPPTRGADRPADPTGVLTGDVTKDLIPSGGITGPFTGSGGMDLGTVGPFNGSGGPQGVITYGAPPMSADMAIVRDGNKAEYKGNIDPNAVRAVIRAHRNEAHYCYLRALQKDPKVAGTVKLKFDIQKGGRVTSCTVVQNLSDPDVGNCLCGRVKTWRFPEPTEGSVTVTYPWIFEPAKD
ncbi:TonB family protein [Myxococcota bacterium]|nr:TonB family protein [Myxococcota bacterium]MBU1511762.1 TonB family protein [Myxococcota bacterium]